MSFCIPILGILVRQQARKAWQRGHHGLPLPSKIARLGALQVAVPLLGLDVFQHAGNGSHPLWVRVKAVQQHRRLWGSLGVDDWHRRAMCRQPQRPLGGADDELRHEHGPCSGRHYFLPGRRVRNCLMVESCGMRVRREAVDVAGVMLRMFGGARQVIPVLQPLAFLSIGIH